jgi:hypothetical protein
MKGTAEAVPFGFAENKLVVNAVHEGAEFA